MSQQNNIEYLEKIIKSVVGSPELGTVNFDTLREALEIIVDLLATKGDTNAGKGSSLQVGDSSSRRKSGIITVQQFEDLAEEIAQLKQFVLGQTTDSQQVTSVDEQSPSRLDKKSTLDDDGDVAELREEVARLNSEVNRLSELVKSHGAAAPQSAVSDSINMDVIVLKDKIATLDKHIPRIGQLEKKLTEYTMQFDNLDIINNQISECQDQIIELEKEIGEMKCAIEKLSTKSDIDVKGNLEIYKKIDELEDLLSNANIIITQLIADKEEHAEYIQNLIEQIEFLKSVKMDREDLEEALADKADHRMVQRKVSHDQFELAYNDLSRGLERAVAKLTSHESLWQRALDDIQQEIENKMDRLEISPLTEFVNDNLAKLHATIREMTKTQREFDAAGTQRKYIRNLNCISCESQAFMSATAKPSLPGFKPLPVRRTIGPYLTYKLDSLRKNEICLPGRNISDCETEIKPKWDGAETSQNMMNVAVTKNEIELIVESIG